MSINRYNLLKKKSILYVEDDLELQGETVEILKGFFGKIYTALDGMEGYDVFVNNSIDVVLADINMPELNGIEMIKLIRENDDSVAIAVISAYTHTDYLLESIELNLIKYLVKPLTTKKIIQLLDKLIDIFDDKRVSLNSECEIDLNNCQVKYRDKIESLTKKEAKFIEYLMSHSVVTYDMLYNTIWEYDKSPSDNAIRSFIKKIRKKLPVDCIKNKQGVGYFLDLK